MFKVTVDQSLRSDSSLDVSDAGAINILSCGLDHDECTVQRSVCIAGDSCPQVAVAVELELANIDGSAAGQFSNEVIRAGAHGAEHVQSRADDMTSQSVVQLGNIDPCIAILTAVGTIQCVFDVAPDTAVFELDGVNVDSNAAFQLEEDSAAADRVNCIHCGEGGASQCEVTVLTNRLALLVNLHDISCLLGGLIHGDPAVDAFLDPTKDVAAIGGDLGDNQIVVDGQAALDSAVGICVHVDGLIVYTNVAGECIADISLVRCGPTVQRPCS